MDRLPDELIDQILDYLEPLELVVLQRVSRRLLKHARDKRIWRIQCYYDSPKATINRIGQKSWSQALAQSLVGGQEISPQHSSRSYRARAVEEWDFSDPSEEVDWYSEYIARHAQLSASWLAPQHGKYRDIRGAALFSDNEEKKLLGPLEDGSVCVWSLSQEDREPSRHLRLSQNPASSLPGILLRDCTTSSRPFQQDAKRIWAFSGVTDGVSVDSARQRAYVAVADSLSEVDLNTLKVVSRLKYAWTITALSQFRSPQQPLTVGTSFSLHILDPRNPSSNASCSPVGRADLTDCVAFFPNKDLEHKTDPARRLQIHPFGGFGSAGLDPESPSHTAIASSYRWARRSLSSYAKLEPAPLSILHQTDHSIMVAGRFPSILNYDRRYFPRLEYVIHSSARLSALAYLPFPTRDATRSLASKRQGTLISCGEYNGRGSLELYSVPHDASSGSADLSSGEASTLSDTFQSDSSDAGNACHGNDQTAPGIYSYKNRQTVSPAKLLSVATHGTRIVFSDAEGGLKWIERDGRTIARKWNINSHPLHQRSFARARQNHDRGSSTGGGGADAGGWVNLCEAAIYGEEVVRKIIPTGPKEANDLLVWTGERVGLVSFGRNEFFDAEEGHPSGLGARDAIRTLDASLGLDSTDGGEGGALDERARQHDRQMRRALERQADELNWMQRFGFGSN